MPRQLLLIKQELDSKLGQEIVLTAFGGRKRKTERKGILRETYHSVFVVDLDKTQNKYDRVSYSYTDILTSAIQVSFSAEEAI